MSVANVGTYCGSSMKRHEESYYVPILHWYFLSSAQSASLPKVFHEDGLSCLHSHRAG
jgi:hypothetical protein